MNLNQPYVKRKNPETGELINPINGRYPTLYANRRQRRKRPDRFRNNRKTTPLTLTGQYVYARRLQIETNKEGERKYIYHYDLLS